jgi:hypothetical protein
MFEGRRSRRYLNMGQSMTDILLGQLVVCANCARDSADEFTYLNTAARQMMRDAADEIDALTTALDNERAAHQVACQMRDEREVEIGRLRAIRDGCERMLQERKAEVERLREELDLAYREIKAMRVARTLDEQKEAWSQERCRAVDRSNIPATCDWPRCGGAR